MKRNRIGTAALVVVSICHAAPSVAQNLDMQGFEKRVQHIFEVAYADQCEVDRSSQSDLPPEIYRSTFNYRDEDYDPRPFALMKFHCFYGAYNEVDVFYQVDDYGEIRQVQFAVPDFEVTYVGDDFDGAVDSIEFTGFTTQDMLVNSSVDEETLTVTSWSKWRGIGDATSSGTWVFKDGDFVLIAYDVDASYDGQVNPERIFGKGSPGYGDD